MTVSITGKNAQSEKRKIEFLDVTGLRKKFQPYGSSLLTHEGLTCREQGKPVLSLITISFRYLVLREKQSTGL